MPERYDRGIAGYQKAGAALAKQMEASEKRHKKEQKRKK
jgi:hypothetical protein|tara:strand:+ start:902 stop:1018 length:117 start_codon:yes stop_codon:yes gene_type:complete